MSMSYLVLRFEQTTLYHNVNVLFSTSILTDHFISQCQCLILVLKLEQTTLYHNVNVLFST